MDEQPSFYDSVNKLIENKQYSLATAMITAEKERLMGEYNRSIGPAMSNNDACLGDFYANDVAAASIDLGKSFRPIHDLEKKILSLQGMDTSKTQ